MKGSVVSVNVSSKKGTIKIPVESCRLIEDYGLENDAHAETGIRQVSLLGQESIDKMIKEGVKDLTYGKFAENITTSGIELYTLEIGTFLDIGEIILQVTKIGKECHGGCDIKKQTGRCVMPTEGIFARVIRGGVIKAGDVIIVRTA